MTEKQAWLAMAEEWYNAVYAEGANSFYTPRGNSGICPQLEDFQGIARDTLLAMRAKLDKHLPKKNVTRLRHKWYRDADGAKARAAFCRQMAAMCEDQ